MAQDLLKLIAENIKGEGENLYFELKQQKTDKKIFVPLTQRAKKIVSDFPKSISYDYFLKKIKIICQLAEINAPRRAKKEKPKTEFPTAPKNPNTNW